MLTPSQQKYYWGNPINSLTSFVVVVQVSHTDQTPYAHGGVDGEWVEVNYRKGVWSVQKRDNKQLAAVDNRRVITVQLEQQDNPVDVDF